MNKVLENLFSKRLNQNYTLELTPEEERAVLDFLKGSESLGCGSSRVVYPLGNDYVVKVPMSIGGINQCKIERDFYKNFCNEGVFAHIYAYGSLITIMERLDSCDYYDLEELEYEERDEEVENEDRSNLIALINEANELTDYWGGDNGQVGISRITGTFVLYDYGYSNDYRRAEIVDEADWWSRYIDPISNAIEILEKDLVPSQKEMDERCLKKQEEE